MVLNTRSTGRRNEAQLPTCVELLTFLKSSAVNECQQSLQSALFFSNTDAYRDGQYLGATLSCLDTGDQF